MAKHAQLQVQTKVFSILEGDSTLSSMVNGVFDSVKDNQKFPYVALGELALNDFGSKTTSGFEGDFTVHVYSQVAGKQECLKILNRIYELLHNISLGLAEFPTINFRCTLNRVLKDPDNKTHHGIQTYRLILGGN